MSSDDQRMVVKAVQLFRINDYCDVRLQGSRLPKKALARRIRSPRVDGVASLEHPDAIIRELRI